MGAIVKLISLLGLILLSACSTMNQKSSQKTIVLIHGAHLDGASWAPVKSYLEKNNQKVIAPTLPGRDSNKNVDIVSYAQAVCDVTPDGSVLVGHSQGGAVANQMVGLCPEKIAKIIYVAAVVPLNGERPYDLMGKPDEKTYGKVVV